MKRNLMLEQNMRYLRNKGRRSPLKSPKRTNSSSSKRSRSRSRSSSRSSRRRNKFGRINKLGRRNW
jgi:hypothetical protein